MASRVGSKSSKKKGRPFDDPENPKEPITNFRTSKAERDVIDQAASIVSETAGVFARRVTLKEARKILKKRETED